MDWPDNSTHKNPSWAWSIHSLQSFSEIFFTLTRPLRAYVIRGFIKLKKIQKSEKNKWVGGSSLNSDYYFFLEILCCFHATKCFRKKIKNWIRGLVGGVWPIRVFLGVLDFFQLDKTPKRICTLMVKIVIIFIEIKLVIVCYETYNLRTTKHITSGQPLTQIVSI